jgi:hypothetical protein
VYPAIYSESGAGLAPAQLVHFQSRVRWPTVRLCLPLPMLSRFHCEYRDPMRHTYITGGTSTAVAFANQLKALEDDLRKKSSGSNGGFGSRYLHVPMSSLEGSPSGGGDRHSSTKLSDVGKRMFQSPSGLVGPPVSIAAPAKSPDIHGDPQRTLEPRSSFVFHSASPPSTSDASALRPPTSFAVQTSWHGPRSCPHMGRRSRVTVRDVAAVLEEDQPSLLDVSPILPARQLGKRDTVQSGTVIGSNVVSPPKFSYHFGPDGGSDLVASPTTMGATDGFPSRITALPQASPFSLLSQRKRLQPVSFTA